MIRGLIMLSLALCCAAGAEKTFTAAYVHLSHVFDSKATEENRRADIIKSVASAKRAGLTTVLPYAASSAGVAYYPSTYHPKSAYGTWDALGIYIEEARKAGLEVFPAVPVMTSGHTRPLGILATHPEWALRDKKGAPIGYISSANPEAREWVAGMLRELVDRYGLKGLLLDYLRFPNKPIDLDPQGAAQFLEETGGHPYQLTDRGNTPWQRYKEKSLTTLMREIRAALPDTQLALYCWGPHVTQGHYVGQQWDAWAKAGYLDLINVSGYCYTENYGEEYMKAFRDRLTKARALVKPGESDARFTFCLGIVTSHGGIKNSAEIKDYLNASREAGMKGVAFFTLNTLEAHLDDVVERGYIRDYTADSGTGSPRRSTR